MGGYNIGMSTWIGIGELYYMGSGVRANGYQACLVYVALGNVSMNETGSME